MGEESERPLKKTMKEWAKDYFLITPWNLLAFGLTLALTKWLCGVVGQTAYGTVSGNFKLSGIMFLAAIVAVIFGAVGQALFKIGEKKLTDKFWLIGMWMLLCLGGCVWFFGRAMLILIHIIDPGSKPPKYIEWVLDPNSIDWLLKLGT